MSRDMSSWCLGVREPMLMAESAKAESMVQADGGRMEESVGSGDCCGCDIVIAANDGDSKGNDNDRYL